MTEWKFVFVWFLFEQPIELSLPGMVFCHCGVAGGISVAADLVEAGVLLEELRK